MKFTNFNLYNLLFTFLFSFINVHYFLAFIFQIFLWSAWYGKGIIINIFCNSAACCNKHIFTNFYRCNNLGIASNKYIIINNSFIFIISIIITCNCAAAYIYIFTDFLQSYQPYYLFQGMSRGEDEPLGQLMSQSQ